jgi:hypothetical protein
VSRVGHGKAADHSCGGSSGVAKKSAARSKFSHIVSRIYTGEGRGVNEEIAT